MDINDFSEAIQSEFYSGVIAAVLDEHQESLDEETMMAEIYNELKLKVCLDGENVSLNALELFTRDKDLKRAITDLVTECAQR